MFVIAFERRTLFAGSTHARTRARGARTALAFVDGSMPINSCSRQEMSFSLNQESGTRTETEAVRDVVLHCVVFCCIV